MVIFNVDDQQRLVDYLTITANESSLDLLCGKYLCGQAQQALSGAYVPRESIYYKPFNAKSTENKNAHFLKSLISHNLTGLPSIPLRQLTFVYEYFPGQLSSLSEIEGWLESMRTDREIQKIMKDYERYHIEREQDVQNRTITAVQTDQGVLLFNDSGRGLQCVTDYLQDIANRYFSPAFKNLETLQVYYFSTSNSHLVEESRQCAAMFSADAPHQFIPSNAHFLDSRIVKDLSPAIQLPMAPDKNDYRTFAETFGLEISQQNQNIAFLDEIYKNGLSEYQYNLFPEFLYKNSFSGIMNRLGNSFIHEREHEFMKQSLQNTARDIAKRILQTEYNVRGYEKTKVERQKPKLQKRKGQKQ